MPTRIDVAAEAAQQEISNVVKQIDSNLDAQPRLEDNESSLPSPLFRDEVQHQEMRYLDRMLLATKPAADRNHQQSQSGDANAGDGNKSKRFGPSPKAKVQHRHHSPKRSKIATILSPYDRKDSGERNLAHRNGNESSDTQMESKTQKSPLKQLGQNKSDMKNGTSNQNQSDTISHKLRKKISNLIHPSKQEKSNYKRQDQNQKRARTAVPSRNRRRQMNQKVIQRAKIGSRRVITKMVRLGRQCTQNLTTIKEAIHMSVARAVANAHSMLEQSSAINRIQYANRGLEVKVDMSEKVGTVHEAGKAQSTVTNQREASTPSSMPSHSQNNFSQPVPPKDAFALASSWIHSSTESISSQAVSMVQKAVHKENSMSR